MRRLSRLGRMFGMLWLGFVGSVALLRMLVVRAGLNRGDPESDDPRLVLVGDGTEFASKAGSLHGGGVLILFGGAELDLSGARLHPAGGTLRIAMAFGGATVTPPPGCRVTVTNTTIAGGVENHARDRELPEDAPQLHIEALTLCGGMEVKAG